MYGSITDQASCQYHGQMGLQFNLKPLDIALQLLNLYAGRRKGLCLRHHILLHRCDLSRSEKEIQK